MSHVDCRAQRGELDPAAEGADLGTASEDATQAQGIPPHVLLYCQQSN